MKRVSGAERRKQIVDAAHKVILEKGLAEAATRDVTRRLKVGSGLLHHYFSSWQLLRAEAVQTSVMAELDALQGTLQAVAASERVERFVDWMADDDEMRHWSLWLNAIDTARHDPEMAAVVGEAYDRWHALIANLLMTIAREENVLLEDAGLAAWRLAALIDGLASIALSEKSPLTLENAKMLLHQQFALELSANRHDKSDLHPINARK